MVLSDGGFENRGVQRGTLLSWAILDAQVAAAFILGAQESAAFGFPDATE